MLATAFETGNRAAIQANSRAQFGLGEPQFVLGICTRHYRAGEPFLRVGSRGSPDVHIHIILIKCACAADRQRGHEP